MGKEGELARVDPLAASTPAQREPGIEARCGRRCIAEVDRWPDDRSGVTTRPIDAEIDRRASDALLAFAVLTVVS